MKRRYILISLLILCLPLLVTGLFWKYLPLQLPLHFTIEGKPDHVGNRSQWFGMVVSTTLFLTVVFRILIQFLPHRHSLHPLRIGAVYLISAVFIASLTSLLILKTVFVSSVYAGVLPVLSTLFVSGFVYFSLPSFMPFSNRKPVRPTTPANQQVLQKIYRLSRSVVVRVNAVIALIMLMVSPEERWLILILANVLAFLVLSILGSHLYRKST